MEPTVRIQAVHANLKHKHEILRNEYQDLKRKLDSKNDALLILSRELAECQGERNQLRVMADQLRSRCQGLKKQILAKDAGMPELFSTTNISSHLEIDELKQKLSDAEGDIKILRAKIVKYRLGTTEPTTPERKPLTASERDALIEELEKSHLEYSQLELDMKQVLDLKEELETERDTYKTKYIRLNKEVNFIMRGDEKHVLDIDALIMENRFLQQRVKHLQEENTASQAALKKYKYLMEKKKPTSILKSTTNHVIGGLLISQRQVRQLLAAPSNSTGSTSPQMIQELKTLAATLLDAINDKNLALNHQRKSNKLLGSRITDLENKLYQMELSGESNNFKEMLGNLEELRASCASLKMLVPNSSTEGSEVDTASQDTVDNLGDEKSAAVTAVECPDENVPEYSCEQSAAAPVCLLDQGEANDSCYSEKPELEVSYVIPLLDNGEGDAAYTEIKEPEISLSTDTPSASESVTVHASLAEESPFNETSLAEESPISETTPSFETQTVPTCDKLPNSSNLSAATMISTEPEDSIDPAAHEFTLERPLVCETIPSDFNANGNFVKGMVRF